MIRSLIHTTVICVGTGILLGCSGGPPDRVPSPPPNIILISIDTLRSDHLGCYGYHRPTSPNIDQFAAENVLFENFINTGGGTLPVHASMFTSLPPVVHDVKPDLKSSLDGWWITLAERLRDAGYETAGFTGGGFVRAKFGLGQGFKHFYDEGGDFQVIMPLLFDWLDQQADRPFFLFIHTYDVHSDKHELPYDSPGDFNFTFVDPDYSGTFSGCRDERCASELMAWFNKAVQRGEVRRDAYFTAEELQFFVDLYDGGILYADAELGRLFDRLKEMDLYDESVIVVTSDHGEEFLEHGLLLHHQNYAEIARVPFIIKTGRNQIPGLRIDGLASTLEVAPTLLELAGLEPNSAMMGHSLLPVMMNPSPSGRSSIYMAGGLEKMRTREWTLAIGRQGPVQLFNVELDPYEQVNVIREHPEVARQLHSIYLEERSRQLQWREDNKAPSERESTGLTPEEIADLEALGYLEPGR